MQFGPEVNAYTNQNETVYMLQVPTDQPELLAKGLQILEEWAHRVSFDDEEIDKERGVIVEEWRLGRGADERMYDTQLPIIFHGSRYAVRNTIGDPEIISNVPHDTLRRFYRDWYRPDLMAVVAVGDFDGAAVEASIRERFAAIPRPPRRGRCCSRRCPTTTATLYAVTTDPEASSTFVSRAHQARAGPGGDRRRLPPRRCSASSPTRCCATVSRSCRARPTRPSPTPSPSTAGRRGPRASTPWRPS